MSKAQILQEIRRTADANGGRALGRKRFQAETGIAESDWYGIYWARWGDAVREAGLSPNQLQAAYEKADLLAKLAKLTQRLGRIPARGDLKLGRRSDSNLPVANTFARIGKKPELVAQLSAYCRNSRGYEDVVRLCDEYLAKLRHAVPGAQGVRG